MTQSGETADTIAPTRLARERGCPIIAVTNTVGSAITREADAVLFLQAGPEIAVAAIKTFVTQVTTLVILAAAIAKARGSVARGRRARARARPCGRCRTRPQRALELTPPMPPRSRAATSTRAASCSSAGATTYPAALEGALKLKEISYVHAEGYAAGELKHGPISLLDAECPLVAVATRSSDLRQADQQRHGGPRARRAVIAVATEGDPQIERFADDVLLGPGHARGAEPGARGHPAPAVRLPHGGGAGHGRRPAAQPREVGHGRVARRR